MRRFRAWWGKGCFALAGSAFGWAWASAPALAQHVGFRELTGPGIPIEEDRRTYDGLQDRLASGMTPGETAWRDAPEEIQQLIQAVDAIMQADLMYATRLLGPLATSNGPTAGLARALWEALLLDRGDYKTLLEHSEQESYLVEALAAGPSPAVTLAGQPEGRIGVGPRGQLSVSASSGPWRGILWLDTGASYTVLSDSLASALEVVFPSTVEIPISTSTGREVPARVGILPQLRIGAAEFRNHRVLVFPNEALRMRDSRGDLGTLHGILGWNAIRWMRLDIDVATGVYAARPSDVAGAWGHGPSNGEGRLTWMGFPLVRLTSTTGQPLLFGLDTGSWNTSLTEHGREALDLPVARTDTVEVTGVGGTRSVPTPLIDQVALVLGKTEVILDEVRLEEDSGADRVVFFEADGVLGADVLRGSTVVLDPPRGLFEIRPRDRGEAVVFLVRHAETATDSSTATDPPLSATGQIRAAELADMLADAQLTSIHSTPYRRTRQTAAEVAERAFLPIVLYTPGDSASMAELGRRLRAPGQHLVVGHSNTIPALVAGMGGDPAAPIGEREYDRLYLMTGVAGDAPTSSLLRYGAPSGEGGRAHPPAGIPDPGAVREGVRAFVMRLRGDSVGTARYETRATGSGWRLAETTLLPEVGVDAVYETTVGLDLGPRSFRGTGTMFGEQVDIDVQFDGRRAVGRAQVPQPGGAPLLEIDTPYPPGTLERTSTFFLLSALPLADDVVLGMRWLNTYTGAVEQLSAVVTGRETVAVPAGEFEAFRVELRGGTPSQVVWISTTSPRELVRIEVVGQPWTYELVALESIR